MLFSHYRFTSVSFCLIFSHKPSSGLSLTFSIRPGIRLLGSYVTDAMEATALTFNIHFIDIYVCSWGPPDNGVALDGPKSLTEQALRLGTQKARLHFTFICEFTLLSVGGTADIHTDSGAENGRTECRVLGLYGWI